MQVPKLIRDLFTEDDAGSRWSLAHAMGGSGFVSFNGMAIYHTVTTHQFDPVAMGTGLGAVLAAAGALIFANSKSGVKDDQSH